MPSQPTSFRDQHAHPNLNLLANKLGVAKNLTGVKLVSVSKTPHFL